MNTTDLFHAYTSTLTGFAILLLIGLGIVSIRVQRQTAAIKRLLFGSIATLITCTTLFLVITTLFMNSTAASNGPVHWHADFEIWACGKEITLRMPHGYSNRIGTPLLHEHNDKRIHIEGTVYRPYDASLGNFFRALGGEMKKDMVSVPTDTGIVLMASGISCGDGIDRALQVFVYKTHGAYYTQEKITDPANYQFSPENQVPPGDCIIIELAQAKQKTDLLCSSYKEAVETGVLKGETEK
jgi:hypothetical protein